MHVRDIVGDRFLLVQHVATGGMGEVYKALDQQTNLPVAIKALTNHRGDDTARFAREVRILAELDHPRVVRYVAHGALSSGEPYLAMEWLEGEDLSAVLSRRRLTAAETRQLAVRVAEALGFAHALGVVHRDLKPSNIFLPGGHIEEVKLLDFGVAQAGAATLVTKTGMLVGTPAYMAPEQARGGERLSPQADVFSLGCVLFECLIGQPAFTGVHFMAVLARILFDEPPRVRDKRPDVPEALSLLVERMLAKSPEDRPCDGLAVAEALRALGTMPTIVADKPARGGLHPKTLTGSEQRAVAVILISAPSPEGGKTEEFHQAATVDARFDDGFLREARVHGGHLECLLDGSVAVLLTSTSLATDLAAQAARCALSLGARVPGRSVTLAMGRGGGTGRLAMGVAIDRAVRLASTSPRQEAAPEASEVLLDEVAAGLLPARFDVRESPEGFVLHGEREIAEGTRTLLGKATPCVGRDWELRTLDELFEECVGDSTARAVLVTAPAGGGKSRLAQEFLRHIKERGEANAIWSGRGDPLRVSSAFSLLGQALRGTCQIREGEPLKARRDKLLARVGERTPPRERQRVAPFLGELIGTPFPDDEDLPLRAARRDAQIMNDQMRDAFLTFLEAECAAGPVLILLEDLHWGDRPTVQFLDRALADLDSTPLFILALARPEVHKLFPKLWGERRIQEIRLKELSRKAIERLARYVLGERIGRETIERLGRLSEGNAFYLEELIRRAAEGRGVEFPESVVAMVQSRLGALDDEKRRILRAASVFGEVFWTGGVASLIGRDRAERMDAELHELSSREVIVPRGERRFPGEEEFSFRHALLREGAYTMLTDEDRRLGHQLVGEWLEQRGEQDLLVLAEHFEKGGDGARAGQAYLQAAEQALCGNDVAAAVAHLRRGLASSPPEALRMRLLGRLCEAGFWHPEALRTALEGAEELVLVAPLGSVPWIQGMFAKLTDAIHTGRFDEVLVMLAALKETEISQETGGPLSVALGGCAYLLTIAGRMEEADAVLERLNAIVHETEGREPLASLWLHCVCAAWNASMKRDPWSALKHSNSYLAAARAIDHSRHVEGAHQCVGINLWFLGARADAERTLKEVAQPDGELGVGSSARHFCLAWMLAERGAFDEARAWASRLVVLGQALRLTLVEAHGRWVLAEVQRRAGEIDIVEEEIEVTRAMLGPAPRPEHPGVLATLAALRLAQGRHGEACAAAAEALAKEERAGYTGFFRGAFVRLIHAECLEAAENHVAARVAIARARARIMAIADKIGDLAYRRSFLDDVPENRRTLDLAQRWLGELEQG